MASSTSSLEWSLITSTPPTDESGASRLRELGSAVLEADFKTVLLSTEAQEVFKQAPELFDGLIELEGVASSSNGHSANDEASLLRLIIAIALQHAFVQANWTGPDLPFSPLDLLPTSNTSTIEDLNATALPYLTLHGEPAYHLSTHPILFLLSVRLLASLKKDKLETLPWWRLRSHLVHQALLDEHVELPVTMSEAVHELLSSLPDDPDIKATLHLELGLLHHSLGQDKPANQEFLSAARASGLEFELTGALGKKTKFQQEALSQLVLLAKSRVRDSDGERMSNGTNTKEEGANSLPPTLALNDDTLLEETEFTKISSPSGSRLSHLDPSSQPPLHPLDQALLLSHCLAQHNNSPSSGLTASQMMPFISRVVSHPRNWSVHTTALLLRSRLESTRSRTVERSTLQLSALLEQMPTSDSSPKERLRYFHQLPLPSKWLMERELAKRYLSLGVVRSALDIFTRLEMWEDAVDCLQRMEREDEAEKIVTDLLEGRKIESDLVHVLGRENLSEVRRTKLNSAREGKLWCVLGDLSLSSENAAKDPIKARETAIGHYNRAWEVSKQTSSRAQRSLGSLHVTSKEWALAIPCFQVALEINPLWGRAWFTLGVCFVRLERWTEAREAFRRQVGVDEDDGEGWNNLAAVYLRLGEEGLAKGETPPPVSLENKTLAHRALRQGLRHAHNNWRMWQNYMIVSVDVGELAEAARAHTRVIEETGGHVDYDVLDKLVDSVTRDDWQSNQTFVPKSSNEGFGLLPIVDRLFDQTIFPRISDSTRIWRTHARLLRWKEDWQGAMEDTLKAYRCGLALDPRVERDIGIWREAVGEIEELVGVLRLLGPKISGGAEEEKGKKKGDWRFQARGIVRTFIGRTKESFEDEPEMERLKEILDELKRGD